MPIVMPQAQCCPRIAMPVMTNTIAQMVSITNKARIVKRGKNIEVQPIGGGPAIQIVSFIIFSLEVFLIVAYCDIPAKSTAFSSDSRCQLFANFVNLLR